jgi:hypothetical protein
VEQGVHHLGEVISRAACVIPMASRWRQASLPLASSLPHPAGTNLVEALWADEHASAGRWPSALTVPLTGALGRPGGRR